LDFMILSPLGAVVMSSLRVTPSQFGLVVSAYAFSAGISGLLAAGFADRFDRKRLLLFFYGGFVLGTLFCGLAPSYPFLLAARMVTGIFGGVIGSITFAIITDLFPFELRGRVMGFVQTAFAASQLLGIPLGLFFANRWGWHAPFLMIVIVSTIAGAVIVKYLRPIDAHLKLKTERTPFAHLRATVTTPRYLRAFAFVTLVSTGGFMLMPFSSAFSVHNLGVPLESLPLMYLITGVCAIVAGPLMGKLSDTVGKFKIFAFGSVLGLVSITYYSRLGVTPFAIVVITSALTFIGVSARMISSQALLSAIPAPASRGSFMSVSSSVQQISGGFASVLAGMIVSEGPGGVLQHFDVLANVVAGTIATTVVMMWFLAREITTPN
jgi:predicted MFS family arabinose efflux permease